MIDKISVRRSELYDRYHKKKMLCIRYHLSMYLRQNQDLNLCR